MGDGEIVKRETSIDPSTLSKFETYEDYLSYYLQLDETSTVVSWVKADLLLHMYEKLGSNSILALSRDIKQPQGTVVNYVRTARAFPPDKRNPTVSFTHHFQASFADEYDEEKGAFLTDARHEWVERAADEGLSVSKLKQEIKVKKIESGVMEIKACSRCGATDKITKKYILYSPGEKSEKFYFDEDCLQEVINFGNGQDKEREG